ncbi:MAG: 3-phosphoglycerate dehydrogenase [Betaproteobacteria bacterium]|nr:3-phosphoglycerate dehydrogenase [Betaproteobacteria bacterium]
MKIAVPDDYQQLVATLDCYAELRGHDVRVFQGPAKNADELVTQLNDAEAVVLIRERTAMTADVIARLPRLRHIGQTGRSTHHIDVAACTARGITVSHGTHASAHTIAEYTWALILASRRDIADQMQTMRRGEWLPRLGRGLHGKTLGIHGFGKIGSLVAQAGKVFGMRVITWGGDESRRRALDAGCECVATKHALYSQSDVLSLNLRLSERTRHSVTASDLAAMQPSSLLVNTARAEIIEPGALEAALTAGRPGYAAVDVYENEPVLSGDHPLLKMNNALCTPHSAWIEKEMFECYFGEAFENVVNFARGAPTNLVNPSAQQR